MKSIFIYEKSDQFPLNGGNPCGSTPECTVSYNNNNYIIIIKKL